MKNRPQFPRASTIGVAMALILVSCSDQSANRDIISTHPTQQLIIASGNHQTARVRNDVPEPLTVRLLDAHSRPMSGAPVYWTILSGEGSLISTVTTTDNGGYAQAVWTLGSSASEQRVRASFGSINTVFSAIATAGDPAIVTQLSGDAQTALVGSSLPDSVAVVIHDADGNPVPGVTVNWDLVFGTGVLNPASSITNQSGIAKTAWTLGAETGGLVARASVDGVGEARFSATAVDSEGRSEPKAVARLVLTPEGVALGSIGARTTLLATAYGENAQRVQNVKIDWITLSPSVAVVDANGMVTATGAGRTRVVANAVCCNRADTSYVTVAQQATSLTITPKPVSVPVAASTTVSATARDANNNIVSGTRVSWNSSNTTVATVSEGVVTGLKSGIVKIRAASGSLVDSVTVTVGTVSTPATVGAVTITPSRASVQVGNTADLQALVTDVSGNQLSGQTVTWSSSRPAVASVSTSGRVTALASGTTVITAAAGGKSGISEIAVTTGTATVSSVSVLPATSTIGVGVTLQLQASARDAQGNVLSGVTFAWSTLNPGIATVNTGGAVTGVAAGVAQISASAGGKIATATITVSANGTSVSRLVVTQDSVKLTALGAQSALSATAYDANGQALPSIAVSWRTSNAMVASIDSTGRVTARGVGTALIIATALCCNKADTTTAIVMQKVAAVIVSPHATTITTGSATSLSARVLDANANVIPSAPVTWASSNLQIATVSNGTVAAVGTGTAVIRATSGSYSDSASVLVSTSVTPPPGAFVEPAGMTRFASTDGTTLNFGPGWTTTPKWLDTTRNAIVVDTTNPAGSGKVIEKRWLAGELRDNGQGLTSMNQFAFNPRVLYVRLRVKFAPHYDAAPDYGGMKFGYWGMQGGNNSTYATWINTDGMKPYAFLGSEDPTPHHFGPGGYFKTGIWYTLEMIATAQSAKGVADGRFEWWVNGVKIVDAQNQAFVSATSTLGPNFKGYQLYFIRGKVGGTFRVDDWVRIGELYISGK